ncbi:Response regulator 2 [Zostera marina]|uniref:Response regulator 2 n=1 Tax=Zostera marina TaxID=29655 RepID=A0A0K9NXP7_ZOSMR|nr:Response regulator 2 [Zostera marina]
MATEQKMHILVVDDNIIDRLIIERTLKVSSFEVTTVDSVMKALEFLNSTKTPRVDLIVTDYCMPEMNGYDFLKYVKKSEHLKEIPVVIISSDDEPNHNNRLIEEGAIDFLLKPLKRSEIYKQCDSSCSSSGDKTI